MTPPTFHNDDCMQVMADYADDFFDLAIVDPPYGIGTHIIKNNKNRSKLAKAKDYKVYANGKEDRPNAAYYHELLRVSKNQIIWGANHLADIFDASGPCWIVWNKCVPDGCSFAQCELAYTSFNCSAKMFTYRWSGMHQGYIHDKRKNEFRIHPSQKPVTLYAWLLNQFAEPGFKVLDTHLGSGSSAIAAHYAQCEFVGIEIDEDYFNDFLARYREQTAQVDFFNTAH